jgi:hypothetical protein
LIQFTKLKKKGEKLQHCVNILPEGIREFHFSWLFNHAQQKKHKRIYSKHMQGIIYEYSFSSTFLCPKIEKLK